MTRIELEAYDCLFADKIRQLEKILEIPRQIRGSSMMNSNRRELESEVQRIATDLKEIREACPNLFGE